ncbi:MAG: hypothetical protein J3R72DRAFT_447120 [Linnemannia gamsii]|nr:MAG: hypothetical protein J3R72DRAFT_447117 [Linnemannia gamsii]KAK3839988.1 MAG: hypothetical protein J3R72DRAFT_447120 [Linnemannia gamsii]
MSSGGARKKTKANEDERHLCLLCMKDFSSNASLRTHKSESHDGARERIQPLKCPCCDMFAQTHKGLKNHLLSCSDVGKLTFPLPCSWCKEATILADVQALADHCHHCEAWPLAVVRKEDDMRKFDQELVKNTMHFASAQYAKDMFVAVDMKTAGGDTMFGFVLTSSAHLLGEGKVAFVSPLKHRLEETLEDKDLQLALKPHKYGLLVNVKDYELLEDNDPFCCMPFSGHSELITRKLQGCLIQSGYDVIMCLKVEVYGRSPEEDPHGVASLVSPDVRSFKVVNEMNEGASQLMIGTVRWNVLVTMSVVLTSGKIIVGPHNTAFNPHKASHVWLKKGGEKEMFNNVVRQTRSHFDDDITYKKHACVHPRFLKFNTMPVTLATLWAFKTTARGWSGLKLAAFVFHKLYSDYGVVLLKSDVEKYLREVRPKKDEDDGGILANLNRLVHVMRVKETRPVMEEVNKELKCLANSIQKEQTKLNLGIVTAEVQKVIDGIIMGKM